MTPPDETRGRPNRPAWFTLVVALAVVAMAVISVAIYLGLVARGGTWPLFVLAVASAPLALLAIVQAVQAVASIGKRAPNRKETKAQSES